MIEHNKNFYSLEELKRTRDNLEGYLDNEEVYYFVGAIRYACDEIERLNNIIDKLEKYVYGRIEYCYNNGAYQDVFDVYNEIDMKLQELKGSDKK